MEKGSVVQTGVDRLLEVLKSDGRLSLKDAAVKLGVSTAAVLEWAKMLEEEGLLRIRYKFSTAYLEVKNLMPKEHQKLREELMGEKKILDEKLESTNNFLVALEGEVDKLRRLFGEIGGNLNLSGSLQQSLQQLASLQAKKESIDKKIVASKARFLERLHILDKKLSAEQQTAKQWYTTLYSEVLRGGELLKLEREELRAIQDNERMIEQRLADLRALLDVKVLGKLSADESELSKLRKLLTDIQERYLKMKEELMAEKLALQKLIEQNEGTFKQLENAQQRLIEKMNSCAENFQVTVEEMKEAPQKLQAFFNKKSFVEAILNKIHYNETRLKKRLNELTTRSNALGKELSLEKFKKELEGLELAIKELESKREYFTEELKNLLDLLKK